MIVGVAALPTAPITLDGVSATVPRDLAAVRGACARALAGLAPADMAVLIAGQAPTLACAGRAAVDLAGYGLPHLVATLQVDAAATAAAQAATAAARLDDGLLPPDLSVLALHATALEVPVVALAVPAAASAADLQAAGAALAHGLAGRRAVVLAAGDLSAGLRADSPRPSIPGAAAFDERVVAALDGGRPDAIARLGPAEAARVHARGWAALTVLAGVCAAARLATVVRCYAAPRGVGYVVAAGG